MIDMHSHILFGMDDGAKDLQESLDMAQEYLNQGVYSVAATSHFDIAKDDLEKFQKKYRQNRFELRKALFKKDICLNINQGAELYFRPELLGHDLSDFCLHNTNLLLIELPTRTIPARIHHVFEELIFAGYRPILAHVERYQVLRDDLELFHQLYDMGVLMQVNASYLLEHPKDSFTQAMLKKDMIDIIASDAHAKDGKRGIYFNELWKHVEQKKYLKKVKDIYTDVYEHRSEKRIKKILNRFY